MLLEEEEVNCLISNYNDYNKNILPLVIKNNYLLEYSNNCYNELNDLINNTNELKQSQMILSNNNSNNNSNNKWKNTFFRGDNTCWLTPNLCKLREMKGVENIIKGMIKICTQLRNASNEPLALKDFSVQFAVYPGNNTSYTRHLDSIQNDNIDITRRQITLIYYVHKEVIGGQLRVYYPNQETNSYQDIEALNSRLVIFQSEVVEHEVRPTQSIRMAITMWASGKGNFGKYSQSNSIPKQIQESKLEIIQNNQHIEPLIHSITFDETIPISLQNAQNNSTTFHLNKELTQSLSIETIFISIVSYRDSELKYTIRDIFEKSEYPARIFIGIVLQLYDGEDSEDIYGLNQLYNSEFINSSKYDQIKDLFVSNIRIIRMNASESRGPCYVRSLVNQLYLGEKYYLQIDAHMRFRPFFDSYLLQLYLQCLNLMKINEFPIITTYPPGYYQRNNENFDDRYPSDIRPTLLVPSHFDSDGILRQKGRILKGILREPIETFLWAAGFNFTESIYYIDLVLYDPTLDYLFFGEEINMSARLFSYGGRFFCPPQTIIYHLWSRDHRPINKQDSDEVFQQKKYLKQKSQNKVRNLLNNNILSSNEYKYGLGSIHTIEEYEKKLNVSFKIYDNNQSIKQIMYSEDIFSNDISHLNNISTNNNTTNSISNRSIDLLNLVQSYLS